ncbi:MAG: hypothetical protein J0M12_12815 [Deltaproteobacteria bacterium]|nr:hypothetical protein [Deltaproteobacteria bacterium]
MKYFSIPSAVILSASGPHAERYLQIRLTNDLKQLTAQRALQAAALTPQGRTEALFTVFSVAPNSYMLIADGGNPQVVLEGLTRFVVTERIEFRDVSSEYVLIHMIPNREKEDMGAFVPVAPSHGHDFSRVSAGSIQFISRQRSAEQGWDIVVPREQSAAFISRLVEKKAVEISSAEQELLRLRAGIPMFPVEIGPEHIFSESGLTQAISFTKGCYTGQEVIAKIDALGKPPRRLLQLKLAGAKAISQKAPVEAEGETRSAGEILSSAVDQESECTWAFASIRSSIDTTKVAISVEGRSATVGASVAAAARME